MKSEQEPGDGQEHSLESFFRLCVLEDEEPCGADRKEQEHRRHHGPEEIAVAEFYPAFAEECGLDEACEAAGKGESAGVVLEEVQGV